MKALRFIFKYIHYFLIAKNEHAIQGPCIFEFVTKVIYGKTEDENCNSIEGLRKELCKSEKTIKITDFGAGSNINNSTKRKIKDVAKNSAKNAKFGKLLYRIIQFYKPNNILELGISTCYLAKANSGGKVFTFEGCPKTAKVAQHSFEKLNIKNTEITLGDFNATLKQKLAELKTIDLAFIDGNHLEVPTITYFKDCLQYANNDTIFIFDDIHWSGGMESAWEQIKKHPKTTVTIDLFFVGIVFIKSELSNEHFTIRF